MSLFGTCSLIDSVSLCLDLALLRDHLPLIFLVTNHPSGLVFGWVSPTSSLGPSSFVVMAGARPRRGLKLKLQEIFMNKLLPTQTNFNCSYTCHGPPIFFRTTPPSLILAPSFYPYFLSSGSCFRALYVPFQTVWPGH